MKVIAFCLGIFGAVMGLVLWTQVAFTVCCVLAPEYAKPVYLDLAPLMSSRLVGDILGLGTPLIALVAAVAIVLAVLPRFQSPATARTVIIGGLLLAILLSVLWIAKWKPSDAEQFYRQLVLGIVPGVLVVISGLLTMKAVNQRP